MKVWNGYSTEHSMNLVMIGHFKEAKDAESAKKLIDKLTAQVDSESELYSPHAERPERRFSDAMLQMLADENFMMVGPVELEQFQYDCRLTLEGEKLILTTDEVDVSAFLKVMLDKGARIEVYSAHAHQDTEYGRGK